MKFYIGIKYVCCPHGSQVPFHSARIKIIWLCFLPYLSEVKKSFLALAGRLGFEQSLWFSYKTYSFCS